MNKMVQILVFIAAIIFITCIVISTFAAVGKQKLCSKLGHRAYMVQLIYEREPEKVPCTVKSSANDRLSEWYFSRTIQECSTKYNIVVESFDKQGFKCRDVTEI